MKKLDLQTENVVKSFREQVHPLAEMIEYIKNYGNMTKRKNHKLTLAQFIKCREHILSLSLAIIISDVVIKDSKRLVKKYNRLKASVLKKIEIDLKQAKEKLRETDETTKKTSVHNRPQ